MPKGRLAYHMVARHGYAIERLKADMAREETRECLVDFLAFEAAGFVWAFLLASGNAVDAKDRALRNELQAAILNVLAAHGIDSSTFVVRPEIEATQWGARSRTSKPVSVERVQ